MPPVKSFFQRIPFIRITSLFFSGILVRFYIQVNFWWIAIPLLLMILFLLAFWNNKHFPGVKIQNIIVSAAIFLSGACYTSPTQSNQLPFGEQKEYYLAEVCQKPAEKANTYQSILRIQSNEKSKAQKVIAYFSKEEFDSSIIAGNQLILFARPQPIKNTGNPFELDYETMMQNKGIFASLYLSPGTYHKTGRQINRFIYRAEHVRDKLVDLLKATKIGQDERAVISALTLGYRSEVDQETMNYFADTGTIHVLSVSGLHVALIFIILNFFFSPVNTGTYGKFIHGILILSCLWSYAFITGFSPTVQRSAVMFSFVIIGNILRRPVNIYNSLFASALVLVLLDPLVLFDIGFQLSYLAVFGIVLIQPPLENMLSVKNKFLKWAWTLFTVSIAAQLITFPLSVYYFEQFPTLFWLSSFVAIPATTLIIWLTIGFFILSPLSMLSDLLAGLIQSITHLLLMILKWMSSWPHAVMEGIIYNQFQTLLMYAFIATFVVYAFSKRKRWLYYGMVLLILFQISMLWTKYSMFNQKILYVYQTKGGLIHCINGRNSYIIKNNDAPFTGNDIYMIRNVCDHLKLEKPSFVNTLNKGELATGDLVVNSKRLCFLSCRIDYTDRLNFYVQGKDLNRFKMINPSLLKKAASQPLRYSSPLNLSDKEAFCIIFTSANKEGIRIYMN